MKKVIRYRILTHRIGDSPVTRGVRCLFDDPNTAVKVAEQLRKYDLYDEVSIDEFTVYVAE